MSLSIPSEPLKIVGGEFQVGCQWIASEHEIRQIIVDYNNYLVNEMQSLTYRRKDVQLYVWGLEAHSQPRRKKKQSDKLVFNVSETNIKKLEWTSEVVS